MHAVPSSSTVRFVLGAIASSLSAVLAMVASSARAQEEPAYGASAAVTRESFEQSRSASIVTRKEVEESGAGDVGDMLERAPGVVVQRTASGSATPILRGLTGYQVLLMLDDMRLNDSLTRAGGSATLNLVDPESVHQIEVVRGPASVLYGSDALGGVVHVRTQDTGARAGGTREVRATAALRGAAAEHAVRVQGAAQVAGSGMGLRLSAARGYAGAVQRGDGLGDQPYTGHQDWSASGKLEAVPARGHRLSLAYHSGHLFDMPRSDVSEPDDVQSTVSLDRDAAVLTYTGRALDRRLYLHSYLGLSLRREHRRRQRPDTDDRERERVRTLQAGLRASGSPWTGGSLELGFETNLERIASTATRRENGERMPLERGRYVDGSHYDLYALYALLTQQVAERLTLLLGTRGTMAIAEAPRDPWFADRPGAARLNRRFVRPVASFGARIQLLPSLAMVASVLGGFRAPNLEDFQAFGGAARGYTVPNLNLREERSWTFEGGLEYLDAGWDLRMYAFSSLLSGLIVRVPTTLNGMSEIDGEQVIGRRNASDSLLVGGELSATRSFDVGVFASAGTAITWGETERPNDAGDSITEPASKVPPPVVVLRTGYDSADKPYFANLTLTAQTKQTRLSEGDHLDVRLCPDGPEGCDEVPGFADLSVRGGIRVRGHLILTLAVENLLNQGYRTYASGAYAPGRNAMAMLRVNL